MISGAKISAQVIEVETFLRSTIVFLKSIFGPDFNFSKVARAVSLETGASTPMKLLIWLPSHVEGHIKQLSCFLAKQMKSADGLVTMSDKLRGIFPPLPTPFVDDKVAFDKWEALITKLAQTKLSGFVVLGSNGETPFITFEEKLELVRTARKSIPKDKTLIVGL